MKTWGWFLGGVAVGLVVALLVGWVWFPLQRAIYTPASMHPQYRDEYLRLVAITYQVEGDLGRAQERLAALASATPTAPLVELIERWIAAGKSAQRLQSLIGLARDLGAATPVMAPYLESVP